MGLYTITATATDAHDVSTSVSITLRIAAPDSALYIIDRINRGFWRLVDLEDPGSAVMVGTFDAVLDSIGGATFIDDILYIANGGSDDALWMLEDLLDPASATRIGGFGSSTLTNPSGMTNIGNVLHIVDSSTESQYTLTDLTAPSTIALTGTYPATLTAPQSVAAIGTTLYINDASGDELWTQTDATDPGGATAADEYRSGISGPTGMDAVTTVLFMADSGSPAHELYRLDNIASVQTIQKVGDFPTALGAIGAMARHGTDPPPTPAPTLPSIASVSAIVGDALNVQLPEAMGGLHPIVYAVANEPAGTAFDPMTRILSGVVTTAATSTVTYTATDGNSEQASRSFTITVAFDTVPTLPEIDEYILSMPAMGEQALLIELPRPQHGNWPMTGSASGLPSWAAHEFDMVMNPNLLPQTHEITGSAPQSAIGDTYSITVTVTDANGDTASQTFNLVIVSDPTAPRIPEIADRSAIQGESYFQVVPRPVGGGTPYAISVTGLPPGLSFNEARFEISGTPTTLGTYTVTYMATEPSGDGGDSDTETFDIVVEADLQPDTPVVANQTVIVGDPFTLVLPAGSGGNTPYAYRAYINADAGTDIWVSFNSGTLTLSGTPAAAGVMNVLYVIRDNDQDIADVSFTITATDPTPAPTVSIDTAAQTIDAGASLQLAATVTGSNTTVGWEADPDAGTFTPPDAATTTWAGASPTAETAYDLTITVTDDQGREATATVTITVRAAVIDAPTVSITTPAQTINAGASLQLAATVTGSNTTILWSANPVAGTFTPTDATPTTWAGPSPNAQTAYEIKITVTDDQNREATATVIITVNAVGAPPVPIVPIVPTVQDEAEILPALAASIDGAARWPGGLMAEVESYRASMFGGPEAATLNVTGPEPGLRWLLSQLRRPVLMSGRQAGPVWWGFVQRVELRLGAILVTVSLDGYRTAIAVQYLRDGQDLGLRSMFHVEQPAASQYGQIELLGAQEVEEPTAARLAGLLDPYLKVARGVEVSRQPATGARVFCRGWSAALEWRHVPRYHENASYGNILDFADGRGQYTGPHSFSTTSDSEWAAWVDFEGRHPSYDMYISSVRVRISGPDEDADANSGYSNDWHASIWQRARTSTGAPTTSDPPSARLGDEIDFNAAGLPRTPSPIPSPPPFPRDITDLVEFDFSQQDILLPQAGFFVVVRGTLTSGFRPGYRTAANASWRWTRTGGSWGDATDTRQAAHDFFTRCRGQALLQLLLDGHDLLRAGPAPGDVGERSYAVYLEGVSTVAHHVQQVQDAEQLAYVIDPARGVHFYGSGQRTFEMGRNGAWRTPVARGSMAFVGQYVARAGERSICEGAVFTPRTGLWDLSFRALPTPSELASQRRSAQRIARQGP